jgi:hypothetical protein
VSVYEQVGPSNNTSHLFKEIAGLNVLEAILTGVVFPESLVCDCQNSDIK